MQRFSYKGWPEIQVCQADEPHLGRIRRGWRSVSAPRQSDLDVAAAVCLPHCCWLTADRYWPDLRVEGYTSRELFLWFTTQVVGSGASVSLISIVLLWACTALVFALLQFVGDHDVVSYLSPENRPTDNENRCAKGPTAHLHMCTSSVFLFTHFHFCMIYGS